jgi:uncharacterized SAM-binding protein YcdF (DUF218 family)
MFVILSKIVVLPFYPVGSAMLLLLAAAIALYRGRGRLGMRLLVIALAVLYLFSTGPFSYFLVRLLERQYDPVDSFPPVSAIVLLTGAEITKAPPRHYDEVNDAADRILYTARLMKAHAAPRLVITGGNIDFLRPVEGSQAMVSYRLLTELMGVDSSLIILEKRAPTTWENGTFTKAILDSMKIRPDIILVTSAMHMPRAAAIFKKLGYTVHPAPTDYTEDLPWRFTFLGLVPNAQSLYDANRALHEIYGLIGYKLMGRI